MGGAADGGGRTLEQTATWAVAAVCFLLVVISIGIEHGIHLIAKWLEKHHKRALHEALEKVKSELMLLGFISLLLTVGQSTISEICVPRSVADSWHPCKTMEASNRSKHYGRSLIGGSGTDKCAKKNKVPFISAAGLSQLHIFIFVLAIFHVIYCITTMALGRLKMRNWKSWELETKTAEYQFSHDPDRFRFARETSFGRRHLSFWSESRVLIWIVCFFRQFVRSVPKVDYLTLRHGFIIAHLAPQSSFRFDFRSYIKRSLEEDFKVVVGISPAIWFFAVLFLLFNTHGWNSYLWFPFIPLIVSLLTFALHSKFSIFLGPCFPGSYIFPPKSEIYTQSTFIPFSVPIFNF
ncbi:MLO-like protein 6 [Canna indica]|uniref:MLO-like protein 6 n=1 Tax=Canna indica TaxID=4628 RepID=A0AAQ3K145_9LILI|nr:MLO-like protein 6 [Canna indica]